MSNGTRVAAWGLTAFAAAMMILSGLWAVFAGIAAIAKDQYFVVGVNYAYKIDTTGWGWLHLIVGLLVLATGVCLMLGQTWARLTGVLLALISAFTQFLWLPYYPLWAILIIALDVFVIWALLTDVERVS